MDRNDARKELVQLMGEQADTLERQTFGGITVTEQREYDDRQDRIHELCGDLDLLDPAA